MTNHDQTYFTFGKQSQRPIQPKIYWSLYCFRIFEFADRYIIIHTDDNIASTEYCYFRAKRILKQAKRPLA